MCIKFNAHRYEQVQEAYRILGKTQVSATCICCIVHGLTKGTGCANMSGFDSESKATFPSIDMNVCTYTPDDIVHCQLLFSTFYSSTTCIYATVYVNDKRWLMKDVKKVQGIKKP